MGKLGAFYTAKMADDYGKPRYHVTDRAGRTSVLTVDLFSVFLRGLDQPGYEGRGVWDADDECWHRAPKEAP